MPVGRYASSPFQHNCRFCRAVSIQLPAYHTTNRVLTPLTTRRARRSFPTLMVSPNTPEIPGGAVTSSSAPRFIQDVVIRLAGNSQDGIQSIGGFLARLAGRTDQDVMTYMTIPSTISGGPSIFQVRMGTGDILSAGDRADIVLFRYDAQAKDLHVVQTIAGGRVVFNDSKS